MKEMNVLKEKGASSSGRYRCEINFPAASCKLIVSIDLDLLMDNLRVLAKGALSLKQKKAPVRKESERFANFVGKEFIANLEKKLYQAVEDLYHQSLEKWILENRRTDDPGYIKRMFKRLGWAGIDFIFVRKALGDPSSNPRLAGEHIETCLSVWKSKIGIKAGRRRKLPPDEQLLAGYEGFQPVIMRVKKSIGRMKKRGASDKEIREWINEEGAKDRVLKGVLEEWPPKILMSKLTPPIALSGETAGSSKPSDLVCELFAGICGLSSETMRKGIQKARLKQKRTDSL